MFKEYDEAVQKRIGDDKCFTGDKAKVEDWAEFVSDPDFVEEFQKVHNNPSVSETDTASGGLLEDTYLHMELALPKRPDDELQFAKATKRLKDANGYLLALQMTIQSLILGSMKLNF